MRSRQGSLDGGECPRGGIQRVLTGHQHGLRAFGPGAFTFDEIGQGTREPKRICTDDPGSQRFQRLGRSVATIGLGDAHNPIVALQLEDGP